MTPELNDANYSTLADFRFELGRFLQFSEKAAYQAGLTAKQHQALLAIRAQGDDGVLVGWVAERLFLKPNSASELVQRLVDHELLTRQPSSDGRQVRLFLTARARDILASLSEIHLAELRQVRPLVEQLLARL